MIATGSDPWPALNTPYVYNTNGQVPSSEIKLLHASRLTNYTGSPDLIHYQRLPRLSLTPQPLQGSWDTILTMQFYSQDNTLFIANPVWLTPIHINFIVMAPIHIRLISPFILFFLPWRSWSTNTAMLPSPSWLAPPPGSAHHLLALSSGGFERLDRTLCDLSCLALNNDKVRIGTAHDGIVLHSTVDTWHETYLKHIYWAAIKWHFMHKYFCELCKSDTSRIRKLTPHKLFLS